MTLAFENCFGRPITEHEMQRRKAQAYQDERRGKAAAKAERKKYHKGWRVTGVRLCDLQEAREAARKEALQAAELGRDPKEWNEENWLMNAKGKPIRAKPYEVYEAAEQCKAIADKSPDWLRVRIEEIKKD